MVKKLQIIREIFNGDGGGGSSGSEETEAKTNKRPFQGRLIT